MEYIYLFDMCWKEGSSGAFPIKHGSIVFKVIQAEDSTKIYFTHKETGEQYYCHYGWALAENTEENRLRIETFLAADEALNKMKKLTKFLRDKVVDLRNPIEL